MCLTQRADFLRCDKDRAKRVLMVEAASARGGSLAMRMMLPPGRWSLLLLHDENGNGHMDKMMGLPREGFGFSRNPVIRMGPPRWEAVRFDHHAAETQAVRVKYMF